MNRAERRKKGIRNTEPVLMIKRSDQAAYLKQLLWTDPDVQQAMNEECRQWMFSRADEVDALILWNLHTTYGFGKKRLLRFAKSLNQLREYYEGRYDVAWVDAIIQHLKHDCDLDIKELGDLIDDQN